MKEFKGAVMQTRKTFEILLLKTMIKKIIDISKLDVLWKQSYALLKMIFVTTFYSVRLYL